MATKSGPYSMTSESTTTAAGPADDLTARFDRALADHRAGAFAAAAAGFADIIARHGALPEPYANLAATWYAMGRFGEAGVAGRQAIALKPDYHQAYSNLATALRAQGRFDDAVRLCHRAATLRPDYAPAYSNLGNTQIDRGDIASAIAACRHALALQPAYPEAHNNLGNALQIAQRLEEAVHHYRLAITARPHYPLAFSNLGNALRELRLFDPAVAAYRTALNQDPHAATIHLNYAMLLLLRGEFREGWAEYEWRWQIPRFQLQRLATAQPAWSGEPLAGRTILLYGEQGYGDVLQFARFVPQVAALGGRVVLRVWNPLVRLLRTVPGVADVISAAGDLPRFDYHLPLMSLPHVFGTDPAHIPASVPYVTAAPDAVAAWRRRLAAVPGLKIGLVWAGDPRRNDHAAHRIDNRRSLHLADFAPLADIPGLALISLQKGEPAAQTQNPPAGLHLFDWMEEIEDFADTAALIDTLDLVISVDTAVAHLAGALGKPVWILSRFDGCWRWLHNRADSPWYPTARLFRQQQRGDWAPVLKNVFDALRRRHAAGTAVPPSS
ncbi:MAG: tetratricopeptide repeat-containing glycosyltransferase family protein [Azospirillaceae bacterium]|nr:tetratricopeptide repeat-containing glycosyltransferase family protein [Azospirillaceae bacterium]